LEGRVAEWQKACDSLAAELAENDVLAKHINYIFKSYNDRKRIKSFAMAKFKPLLNSRLKYYLEKFKLDIGIEITESLGVVTDGADYDFMSGGERTRATVAFMLARFDVQESVYGKQSNVIVLDEVDAKMDEEGVECFADVVLNDLAAKVDAVLVISHKKTMRDVFPNQITIEKHGKLSVIGEMRVCRE
jgi:DNA repair exonuclease SbcCD ATPase subunit